MRATYDPEADAAYVEIVSGVKSFGTEEAAPGVLLDFAPHGSGWAVIGIELLNPKGRPRLARVADEHGFAHLLDDIYAVLGTATGVTVSGAKLGPCSAWVPA